MASISYPRAGYNSGTVTEYEHELLTKKSIAEGVHGHPSDAAPVYADGTGTRVVKVRANVYATIRGSQFYSGSTDTALSSLAANSSGSPRLDLVVLRLDRSDYSINPAVITGTPGANPIAPSPVRNTGSTGVYDLPLAEVRVASGVTALAGNAVTTKAWYIGSDGQIRCTATTMPPNETGRLATDITYGLRMATGSKWLPVAEDWDTTSLPLQSGWSASHNRLSRRNGWVHLALSPQRTGSDIAVQANVLIGTLPDGYRPKYEFEHLGWVVSNGSPAIMTVKTTGQIYAVFWGGLAKNRFTNFASLAFPVQV